jgi:oligoribonuclease (3'-5' exoribonuclease)
MNIFSSTEISYIESVYTNLVDRSLKNLDELLMVITDSQVRMNDAERINAIDHINADMQDKIEFLRNFNDKTGLMAAQRQKDLQEISTLKSLYGLPN